MESVCRGMSTGSDSDEKIAQLLQEVDEAKKHIRAVLMDTEGVSVEKFMDVSDARENEAVKSKFLHIQEILASSHKFMSTVARRNYRAMNVAVGSLLRLQRLRERETENSGELRPEPERLRGIDRLRELRRRESVPEEKGEKSKNSQ
jgi:hypothetical protein